MANEINLTQLYDKDGYSIYPNLPLKTINEEELYGNGNLTIEGGNMEYGYANTSTGLNDNNIDVHCYKNEDSAPKWENYFWAIIDENDKDRFPYMWARTKVNEDSYSYNLWGSIVDVSYVGENGLRYIFTQGGALVVYITSTNESDDNGNVIKKVANNVEITSIIKVYKGDEGINITDVSINADLLNNIFENGNGENSVIAEYDGNNEAKITFKFSKDSIIKNANYSISEDIEVTVENGEKLYITPQLLFIDKNDTEIEIEDEKNNGVLILDIHPNSDAIALTSDGSVFPFDGSYKEFEFEPLLYYGMEKLDIKKSEIDVSINASTSYEKVNDDILIEYINNEDEIIENDDSIVNKVKVKIPNGIKFNASSLRFDVSVTKEGSYDINKDGSIGDNETGTYERTNSFLLIGVKGGKDGKNGQDANILTIDLTNDFDQVFVKEGKIEKTQIISTTATMWVGNEEQYLISEDCSVSITGATDVSVDASVSTDYKEYNIKLTFDNSTKITSNKVIANITLKRDVKESVYDESYGEEKSIDFNIVKLSEFGDDYDLCVTPTTIKYSVDESTGGVSTDVSTIIKVNINKKSTNEDVLPLEKLTDDLTLKYTIDSGDEQIVKGASLPIKINENELPKQLAEFWLYRTYKDASNGDKEILIDYVNVDCLYDATLPVIYQLSTNGIKSIFVDNNGVLSPSVIPIAVKKSIGNQTVVHNTFEESELDGFVFRVGINDDTGLQSGYIYIKDEESIPIKLNNIFPNYNFQAGEYVEISLVNKGDKDDGSDDVQIDSERIHFVKNVTSEFNYIVNISNDSQQVGVVDASNSIYKKQTNTLIRIPIGIQVYKGDELQSIDTSKISVNYDTYAGSVTITPQNNSSSNFTLVINRLFKFIDINTPQPITINIPIDNGAKIFNQNFTLIPAEPGELYKLICYDTFFPYDGDGNYVGKRDASGNQLVRFDVIKGDEYITTDISAWQNNGIRLVSYIDSSVQQYIYNVPDVSKNYIYFKDASTIGGLTINSNGYDYLKNLRVALEIKSVGNTYNLIDYANIECTIGGKNGKTTKTVYVYANIPTNNVDASSLEIPTGGTYDEPFNLDNSVAYTNTNTNTNYYWSKDLSIGDSGTTYVSSRFYIEGNEDNGDWTYPAKLIDSPAMLVEYSENYDYNSNNASLPYFGDFRDECESVEDAMNQWRVYCASRGYGTWGDNISNPKYMAICQYTNYKWTYWQVVKLQGDAKGERGKIVYPAGEWNASTEYKVTNTTSPYVSYGDKYYVLKDNDETLIGIKGIKPTDATYWEEMSTFKSVYTELLIAKYGTVGGAVFYDDPKGNKYMFSTDGKEVDEQAEIGKVVLNDSSNYINFLLNRKDYGMSYVYDLDNYEEEPWDTIREYSAFLPNVLINFTTGDAWFGGSRVEMLKNGIFNVYDKYNEKTTAIYGGGTSKYQITDIVNDGEDSTKEVTYKAIQTIGKEEKRTLYKYIKIDSNLYEEKAGQSSDGKVDVSYYGPINVSGCSNYNEMPDDIYLDVNITDDSLFYDDVISPKGDNVIIDDEELPYYYIYESKVIARSYVLDSTNNYSKLVSPEDISIRTIMDAGAMVKGNLRPIVETGIGLEFDIIEKDEPTTIFFNGSVRTPYLLVEDLNNNNKWIYKFDESSSDEEKVVKPDTIFYEDGYIEANNIVCRNGYFEGELKGNGSFNGIINTSTAIIGNMVVNNEKVDINSNIHIMPDYDISIGSISSNTISYKFDVQNKKNDYIKIKEIIKLASIPTPDSSVGVVTIPKMNLSIVKYSNRINKEYGKKVNVSIYYDAYPKEGDVSRGDISTYSIDGYSKGWYNTGTGRRLTFDETIEETSITIDSSEYNRVDLMLSYETTLLDKQLWDYDTFHIKVQPTDASNNYMKYNDTGNFQIVDKKLKIPQFYASEKGFWFISGSGSKLIIDGAGIRILDASGNLQKDFN